MLCSYILLSEGRTVEAHELHIGDKVRWREPLDADYSYGKVIGAGRTRATIAGSNYYYGNIIEVPMRYLEKVGGKGFGSNSKRQSKRTATKSKL